MPSLLLVDCVRTVVAEGKPVSARNVARRVGGDVFRVQEILRVMVKEGTATSRPASHPGRKGEDATIYFAPSVPPQSLPIFCPPV